MVPAEEWQVHLILGAWHEWVPSKNRISEAKGVFEQVRSNPLTSKITQIWTRMTARLLDVAVATGCTLAFGVALNSMGSPWAYATNHDCSGNRLGNA